MDMESQMSMKADYFNPELTINSGQMFLWQKKRDAWYGIHADRVLKISFEDQHNSCTRYESFPEDRQWEKKLFRMDDDMGKILSTISFDQLVRNSIMRFHGLRVMRQDPVQCMFSFLCASNINIQRIRKILFNLCRKFGKRITVNGDHFFTFPRPRDLHEAKISELASCGAGYRAKSIKMLATKLYNRDIVPEDLIRLSYEDAKRSLLSVHGIGDKTADCILLFSLEKLEAFPIDTWIARTISKEYELPIGEKKTWINDQKHHLSHQQYRCLSKLMRMRFGIYAGYAQQYLYYHSRNNAGRKW
jgi:N-glycosylase/DNA lyase